MALRTLNELHDKTLDTIQMFIQHDYKIDPSVYSENKFIFTTKLVNKRNPNINITIKTVQDDHKRTFTRQFIPARELHVPYEEFSNLKTVYYLSYDNIYADTREEAMRARYKFFAECLGFSANKGNTVQQLADMLANHITDTFCKGTCNESKQSSL